MLQLQQNFMIQILIYPHTFKLNIMHAASASYRIHTASGTTSATSYPPSDVISAKSIHTANSKDWGYFRATLIRP